MSESVNNQRYQGTTSQKNGLSRRSFLKAVAAATAASALPLGSVLADTSALRPNKQDARVVEMWMWESEEQWQAVEELSGLNEQFPDVEFRWTALPLPDLHQKAITSLASGISEGLPSILRTYNPYYRPLVNTQTVLDVTDMIGQYEADIVGSVWQEGLIEGSHYHVPDDTQVILMGYRTDIFEAAGLPTEPDAVAELMSTYDEFLAAGETIMEATGASLTNMAADSNLFTHLSLQNSTGLFDAEGDVIFDSEAHQEAAALAKEVWDSGLTMDVGLYTPQLFQAFKDGQIATYFYPNFYDFILLDNAPETVGLWKVTKLPKINDDSKRARVDAGLGLVIPAILPDDQKQLAAEIALYMKLTEQATVAHMQTFSGAFVSFIPGLEAMADIASPVLDNQFTIQEFLGAVSEEQPYPRLVTSALESDVSAAVSDAMFRILTEDANVGETLTAAADSMRQLQETRGMK